MRLLHERGAEERLKRPVDLTIARINNNALTHHETRLFVGDLTGLDEIAAGPHRLDVTAGDADGVRRNDEADALIGERASRGIDDALEAEASADDAGINDRTVADDAVRKKGDESVVQMEVSCFLLQGFTAMSSFLGFSPTIIPS